MLFESSEDSSQRRPMIFFVLAALVVGTSAGIFTEPSIPTWYAGLIKPSFNPPNWVFAPVWTTLYILMGIAAGRVWRRLPRISWQKRLQSSEIAAWIVQLVLNFLWSGIFFVAHRTGGALIDISALWLAILATLILFWRRDRLAGLLFLPYLAWVSFAFALNLTIWQLNG